MFCLFGCCLCVVGKPAQQQKNPGYDSTKITQERFVMQMRKLPMQKLLPENCPQAQFPTLAPKGPGRIKNTTTY